ncbi:MAG: rRNA maturation RNase YbeY [bacterium]
MRIALAPLRKRAAVVLESLRSADKSVGLVIVGGRAMRALNRQFRNIDETTDVLSFPSDPFPAGEGSDVNDSEIDSIPAREFSDLGDVVVSIDEAVRQAEEDGVSLEVAVDRLFIHGVLHLHGFDHAAARGAKRMRREEDRLLELVHGSGIPAYAAPE